MRVLHAVHDFLPRHRAGSEIYVSNLASAQRRLGYDVTVVCAEYDPTRANGEVRWRIYGGLPVAEIVNNWVGRAFVDTYRPPLVAARLGQVLDAVQPDVLHIHNLFNLSFDLPRMAKARGILVAATLHDYTLFCPSGGQRLHRSENHLCETIDTHRCARCFVESPLYSQLSVGFVASTAPAGIVRGLARLATRVFPKVARNVAVAARDAAMVPVTSEAIDQRLSSARALFADLDIVVAPSEYLRNEVVRLGAGADRVIVSHNGQAPLVGLGPVRPLGSPIRIGFLGTIAWHKGVHVLVEAVRALPSAQYVLKVHGSLSVAPGYVDDLRRAAGNAPIVFPGEYASEDLASILAELDVIVVPSIWPENAPLVIQEAFQSGVPVVASRIGGIPEFVEDGVTGRLVTPNDPADLATAIGEFVDRPEALRELSSSRPAAKLIGVDADEWDHRYRTLLSSIVPPRERA